MEQSKFEWKQRQKESSIDQSLIDQYKLNALEVTILENRGITTEETIESVINPKLHDANLLHDIETIRQMIMHHIEQQSNILVYGDFDADGIISTTLMYKALKNKTSSVNYFIPNRLEEGYGPSAIGLEKSDALDKQLVIFIDNGVSAIEEIKTLREAGIDVIIIDHHQFQDIMPDALILHPNHPDGNYPMPELCASAVVYKLLESMNMASEYDIILAGIATVTDLVPMFDENKALVREALKHMNQRNHPSITQLLKTAGHSGIIDEEIIGFSIGPRLNATGRLGQAHIGVQFLLEEDTAQLLEQTLEIEQMNQTRKQLVEEIFVEAEALVEHTDDIIIVYKDDWHLGVLGIVASKIAENFGKPAIVLSHINGHYTGSARSIEGFNLYAQVEKVRDFLSHFGGHALALGLSVETDKLELFIREINAQAASLELKLKPVKMIDLQLLPDTLTIKEYEKFLKLKPFGQGFQVPTVLAHDTRIGEMRRVGKDKSHIKMQLPSLDLDVIGFGFGHLDDELDTNDHVHLVGTLNINHFNQSRSLQLNLQDFRIDHVQIIDMRSRRNQNFSMISKDEAIFLINDDKEKLGENYYYYGEQLPFTMHTLVLRDLPVDAKALEVSLKERYISKMIIIFNQQRELYFSGIPTQASITQVDDIINAAEDGAIDLKIHAPHLSKKVSVSMDDLKIITEVLEDLNRMTLKNGIIYKEDTKAPLDVDESLHYKRLKQLLHSETQLKMITNEELKQHMNALIQVR